MDTAQLIELHPRLYHMASAGAWPSIQRHGLLSTQALLGLFEVGEPRRTALLTTRRAETVTLRHPVHGEASVRDNKPLTTAKLAASLTDGSTAEQFLASVNSRVFFWPTEQRLNKLVGAKAYRDMPQTVLEVDTASLVRAHESRVALSAINSGATEPFATPRSLATFARIDEFDLNHWQARRGSWRNCVAEVCVDHSVPDIGDHVVRAYVRQPDGSEHPL